MPLLDKVYIFEGFTGNVKELEEIQVSGKKEMKQYHLDQAQRVHMLREVDKMKRSDKIDFYVALLIVIVFVLVIRNKAKIFIKKRE